MYACPQLEKPVAVVWMAEGNLFDTMQIAKITKESQNIYIPTIFQIFMESNSTQAQIVAQMIAQMHV